MFFFKKQVATYYQYRIGFYDFFLIGINGGSHLILTIDNWLSSISVMASPYLQVFKPKASRGILDSSLLLIHKFNYYFPSKYFQTRTTSSYYLTLATITQG